jgi:hypothetical protein
MGAIFGARSSWETVIGNIWIKFSAGDGGTMANDAKLGLVLGVAIVLVIALVFFRNDPAGAKMPNDPAAARTAQSPVATSVR